jgi:hypothetical protein
MSDIAPNNPTIDDAFNAVVVDGTVQANVAPVIEHPNVANENPVFPIVVNHYDNLLAMTGMNIGTRKALVSEGFGSMSSLVRLTTKDLDSLVDMMNKQHRGKSFKSTYPPGTADNEKEIHIGFNSKSTLSVIIHWAERLKRLGKEVRAEDYTSEVDQLARDRMEEEKEIREVAKTQTPVKPTPLKDMTKWRSFFENWNQYMSCCRGPSLTPLTYVYRTQEEPETAPLEDYDDMDAYLVAQTILSGPKFVIDNKRVFDEFKEAITTTGPGWAFIKEFNKGKNGRAAILKLKAQAEGTLNESIRRDDAIKILSTTTYSGPSRNWNIDTLLQKFQYAVSELVEIDGASLPDGQLVTYLVQALKDPSLSYVRDTIRTNATYRNSFHEAQLFVKTFVSSSSIKTETTPRQINDVQTSNGGSGGGKSGGGGKGGSKSGPIKGPVTARSYSPGEWKSLTKEQQEKVKSMRSKKKQVSKPSEEKERSVDSVSREDTAGIKEDHANDKSQPIDDAAGLQFGRGAHKKSVGFVMDKASPSGNGAKKQNLL